MIHWEAKTLLNNYKRERSRLHFPSFFRNFGKIFHMLKAGVGVKVTAEPPDGSNTTLLPWLLRKSQPKVNDLLFKPHSDAHKAQKRWNLKSFKVPLEHRFVWSLWVSETSHLDLSFTRIRATDCQWPIGLGVATKNSRLPNSPLSLPSFSTPFIYLAQPGARGTDGRESNGRWKGHGPRWLRKSPFPTLLPSHERLLSQGPLASTSNLPAPH